jgi:ribosomal-protein-alanine N-acetyltransferase
MTLRTNLLVLREMLATDAADVLVFRDDFEVQKFNSDPLRSVDEAAAFIEGLRVRQAAEREITWEITPGEGCPVVGTAGLYFWNKSATSRRWGHGLGREAVVEVVRFGFERQNLNRIEAATIADNFQSVALLTKLGFRLEGLRREFSWEEDGTFHDSAMYALLRSELIAHAAALPCPG